LKAIFLQARLDSSRLPRKALLDLSGRTVIEHAMESLNNTAADIRVLLTDKLSFNELSYYAEKCGWEIFAGSKDNVLERYVKAAWKFGADIIIRATGDNPLVSSVMAEKAAEVFNTENADYAGIGLLPVGSGVEVLNAQALQRALSENPDSYEKEHVSPFLYRRPERFNIVIPAAPEKFQAPDKRITLDTPDDYNFLKKLFSNLYSNAPLDLDTVVPYLKNKV